ncbi:calcium-binding protein [Novosphingobium sp.]|uniref:calcium-binding protein n=1 Tax=Novosphingobium sp. TaxID=1874826 RepID=UPI00261CF4CD|nr:calcium-binding protein [Novosphingobium sp.]
MALKRLTYGDAADTVSIGSISFDDSNDFIVYTNGGNDDITFYVDGTVYVRAGTGDDKIYAGGSGTGSVYGDDGNDFIKHMPNTYDDGVLKLYGGAGDDTIIGIAGQADMLYGESGNDILDVRSGNTGFGGVGDDTYDIVAGAKVVEYAAGGFDTIRSRSTSFDFANYQNIERFQFMEDTSLLQNVTVKGDANANWANTSSGNDTFLMGAGNDTANGNYGNDKLYGEAGDDTLNGGFGDDYLSGGEGNDILNGDAGRNTLVGGNGDDVYRSLTSFGVNTIVEQSGGGIDTLETSVSVSALAVNVENLKIVSTNHFVAVNATGNNQANVITGHDGNNTLSGMDGADTIYGNRGNDNLNGGAGNDRLFGGWGNDFMYGDAGNDTLYGGQDNDVMNGGDGYDTLLGEEGNDVIHGGGLTDVINGGAGNDRIYGDGGGDQLSGSIGSDTFVFITATDSQIGSGIDKIMDFAKGLDKIDVNLMDANAGLTGNQAFTWGGMDYPGANHAGTMWGQHFDANTYGPEFVRVYGDTNGDGTAEFCFDVLHVTTLSANDFVL